MTTFNNCRQKHDQRLKKELADLQQLARDFENKPLNQWTAKILREHSLGHGFGNYQCTIRMAKRTVIGVGHTPAEARRNAFGIIEDRNPDLAGFCAAMKTAPITERAHYERALQ